MQKPRLPPLDLLAPFEAAARLGSFTRAAAELNVTQSAISQRVRTLEEHLGIALFTRSHRQIALTAQGRELLNGATAALQHLTAATQSVRRSHHSEPLRLGVDTAIADMWLMSRLSRFHREHPDIAIDLTTSDKEHECLRADVAILHGDGDWPDFESTRLFGDEIFPVCAPEYAQRNTFVTPADLSGGDLLDLDYQHWNWMNWGIWLTEKGVESSAARRVFQSNNYSSVIAAARSGWGVALGWRHFVDDDLSNGTLVRALPDQVTTPFGYFLAKRRSPVSVHTAKTFANWILNACSCRTSDQP